MRRGRRFTIASTAMLLLVGCDSRTTQVATQRKAHYTMPSEIVLDVSAERGSGGEIFIVGSTNLPDGTKIGAEVPFGQKRLGQDFEIYISGGKFRSAGFGARGGPRGGPLPPGKYGVHLL